MSSFLGVVGAVAVERASEKGLFGQPYIRLGRLFNVVGYWLYQQGGALGYGLREHPVLLGKLLLASRLEQGSVPKQEGLVEYLGNLREKVASELAQVEGQERTFFQLYAVRELRELGIDITRWPPSKALDKKVTAEFASDVMFISFVKGGAFGYHFSEKFKEYWEHSYKMQPASEWQEMRARGLLLSETQLERPLGPAVAELAKAATEWADAEAPSLLGINEISILKRLSDAAI